MNELSVLCLDNTRLTDRALTVYRRAIETGYVVPDLHRVDGRRGRPPQNPSTNDALGSGRYQRNRRQHRYNYRVGRTDGVEPKPYWRDGRGDRKAQVASKPLVLLRLGSTRLTDRGLETLQEMHRLTYPVSP